MNLSLPRRYTYGTASHAQAFTLIELLVVISIIAVLAGLLLPVIGNVMVKAKGVETKNTAVQVVTAIKSFQTDYGVYPATASTPPTDKSYVDATNAELFSVLKSDNSTYANTLNTRRIKYFEGRDAKSKTLPKAGFVPAGASGKDAKGGGVNEGDLMDSFGMRFCIRMDSGYTDAVANPYTSTATNDEGNETAGNNTILRFGVIVWSYGNDNQIGKKGTKTDVGDDVLSWQ